MDISNLPQAAEADGDGFRKENNRSSVSRSTGA